MKTSILLVAAFTLVAGYSVYQSQQKEQLSDIALENVEALAGGEWDGDNTCHMDEVFWECLSWTTGVACYCGL